MVAALGPPPLTERPLGLLDLLGIKNGGQYPQFLRPELLPVYSLGDWYLQTQAEIVASSQIAISASGPTTFHIVPAGESWAIHQLGLNVTVSMAGTVTRFRCQYFTRINVNSTSLTEPLGRPDTFDGTNVGVPDLTYEPTGLLIVPPGSVIGLQVTNYAGTGGCTLGINARITRFAL